MLFPTQPVPNQAALQAIADAATAAAASAQAASSQLSSTDTYYLLRKQVVTAEVDSAGGVIEAHALDGTTYPIPPLPDTATFSSLTVAGWTYQAGDTYYLYRKQVLQAAVDVNGAVISANFLDGTSTGGSGGGGAVIPIPDPVVYRGDSLANSVPAALNILSQRTVTDFSISGQYSRQIYRRAGSIGVGLTLSGNQIVSGSNSVTAIEGIAVAGSASNTTRDSFQLLSTGSDTTTRSLTGWLGSVHGTLTRTSSGTTNEVYTFTPDAGAVVPAYCPAGEPFQVDNALDSKVHILAAGRNDAWYTSDGITLLMTETAAMVARLGHRRFLIRSVINSLDTTEKLGGALYPSILLVNSALSKAYPNNFLNDRRMFIDHGLADAGITPTSTDLADIAADTIPTSLRKYISGAVDSLHISTPGASAFPGTPPASTLLAGYINNTLISKGW